VWHAAAHVLTHPRGEASRLIWIYGTGMLAFSLFTSVLALWLYRHFGVTEAGVGYFFVYTGLLSLVLRSLLLGPVVDRLGEGGAVRLGTLVLAVGLLLLPAAPSIPVLVVAMATIPVGTALLFPSTTSMLSRAAPPGELGTTMGVAQTFAGMARVIAPIGGTIAFQRLGIHAPFLLSGATMALVGYVAWRVTRPAAAAAAP
jgi:MFS family permease